MMQDPSQQSYGVDTNDINIDDVIVTIEEPDDTSELMFHLEDAVVVYASLPTGSGTAAPAAPSAAQDLFYHHFDYDPLLYFAEYNTNNPIIGNATNDNDDNNNNDTNDSIMACSAEAESEEVHRIRKRSFEKKTTATAFQYSLEPISESEEEIEDEEEE